MNKILTMEYLWNKIRVQGGAYGCGFSIDKTANCFFYSYRDPQPWTSLTTYQESAKFLQDFAQSDGDVERFIIGTVVDLDPHLSHKRQVDTADVWYLTGYSAEKTLETRRELYVHWDGRPAKFCRRFWRRLWEEPTLFASVGPADVFSDKDLSIIDIS